MFWFCFYEIKDLGVLSIYVGAFVWILLSEDGTLEKLWRP